MWLDALEWWVGAIGLAGMLAAIASVYWGLWLSLGRPPGRKTGSLTTLKGAFYTLGGALYFALCFILWRPVPVTPSGWPRIVALAAGAALLYAGITLVIWGRLALGRMYNVSSSLGVQLYADHELITDGPFAVVRHPMYLGLLLVALGGVLVYRVWTFVFLFGNFPGLYLRALREEEALAQEFGDRWSAYVECVPAWLPRLRGRERCGAGGLGDKAPDFTLVNHEMKPTSLRDHRGRRVVLAFYPGAYTGVCKKELCTIRDSIARLEELDAQVLAISVNDPFTNRAFHDENDLNFPLLCDYNREVVRKYGVVHENFAVLKGYTAAKRSVFILDEEGVIRYKWVSEDPRVEPDYGELERQLKRL